MTPVRPIQRRANVPDLFNVFLKPDPPCNPLHTELFLKGKISVKPLILTHFLASKDFSKSRSVLYGCRARHKSLIAGTSHSWGGQQLPQFTGRAQFKTVTDQNCDI